MDPPLFKARTALRSVHGKWYRVGCGPCLLYAAFGTSDDWVCQALGLRVGLTIEVRPKFNGTSMGTATHYYVLQMLSKLLSKNL